MDVQYQSRDRAGYHRSASRSSTSTRMTSHSGNSATSHHSSSSQPHAPRYYPHHISTSVANAASAFAGPGSPRTAGSRPSPQLSREASMESGRQTPVSAFLQEKLQKERQAEGLKLATSSTPRPAHIDTTSAYSDYANSTAGNRSPSRHPGHDLSRPQTSSSGDAGQKKGLALKDMEQVSPSEAILQGRQKDAAT